MKGIFTICWVLTILQLHAQEKIAGQYRDNFGSVITLNPDSTFAYTYHFDMVGTWTVGTYKIVNDTIFFNEVPVYDTVQFNRDKLGDSLVLSDDRKPERIALDAFTNRFFSSSAQDRMSHPLVLIWRKNRLYTLDRHGKLNSKKIKAVTTGKKYVSWYEKVS